MAPSGRDHVIRDEVPTTRSEIERAAGGRAGPRAQEE
jgi:hypothetical protein